MPLLLSYDESPNCAYCLENLQASSETFHRRTKDVRRQMFWKDMKVKIMIGVFVVILIASISGIGVWLANGGSHSTPDGIIICYDMI